MRRFWRWLAGPDRLLDEIRRDLEACAVEVGGEKVVLWDEQRTRALLRLPPDGER